MKNTKKVILGLATAVIIASSYSYACETFACYVGLQTGPQCLCHSSK